MKTNLTDTYNPNQQQMAEQSATRNPCWSFFHGVPLSESGKVMKVHTLNDHQTVEDAVRLFGKHHILSAPVLDSDGSLVGMVDMMDLANFVLKVAPDRSQIEANHLSSLNMAGRALALKPLKDVMSASARDPPAPLNKHNPSSLAVSLFSAGLHRCPILEDDEKEIVGLVSQSTMIRLLGDRINRGDLKIMGEKTLRELGLGQGGVESASVNETIIDLIDQLDQKSVSALALVDEKDNLVGNFSITDLRGLWTDIWPSFLCSAQEYLERHHVGSMSPMLVSIDSTNLIDLVKMMVDQGLHRVWTYDDDEQKACGVISLTDLMKLVNGYELQV